MRLAVHITLFVFVSAVCASPVHIQARNSSTQADSAILKRWPLPIEQSPSAIRILKRSPPLPRYGYWRSLSLKGAWDKYGREVKTDMRKLPSVYIITVDGVDEGKDPQLKLDKLKAEHTDAEILDHEYDKKAKKTFFTVLLLKDNSIPKGRIQCGGRYV